MGRGGSGTGGASGGGDYDGATVGVLVFRELPIGREVRGPRLIPPAVSTSVLCSVTSWRDRAGRG